MKWMWCALVVVALAVVGQAVEVAPTILQER